MMNIKFRMGSVFLKCVVLVIFFLLPAISQSQVLDNNPPSIKWKKINTDHFRIIFPEGYEMNAQKAANTMEHIYVPVSNSLHQRPKKLSLVLQNQNSIANAFVTVAPKRSEFFTTPPQDYNFIGTNDWMHLLAIHEYRHVVQFEKSKTGFTKAFYYLFGETAQALWGNLAVPDWFWEGDATGMETALSHSGRGRIARFDMAFRTNLLERGAYTYNKQHLGSFKDPVPDHYRLGYFFTTYVRSKYGADSWSNITNRAFGLPFIPFTFSTAMKKETGKNLLQNYSDMMNEMNGLWANQLEGLTFTASEKISPETKKVFTSYLYPQQLENGKVVAMKVGLGDAVQMVLLDANETEKKGFLPGILNDVAMLSAAGNKLVWSEFEFDPRWGIKSYSVIKSYDFDKKELKTLTKKTRYAAATLSPNGSKIATIETTQNNKYFVVILEAKNGAVIKKIPNPINAVYGMPRWSTDGNSIVVLKIANGKKSVVSIDFNSEQERVLMTPTEENVGHPMLYGKYLFYNSAYSGIDNIYVLDTATGKKYQVTSKKFGAFNPNISNDGKTIFFNDYTKEGMTVASMPFDIKAWKPIEKVEDRTVRYYEKIVEQEHNANILTTIPDKEYAIASYKKASGIFNIHTWGPEVASSANSIKVGLQMQDVLSTIRTDIGYEYNANEKSGTAIANVSYQGWFPIIDFGYEFGNRSTVRLVTTDSTSSIRNFSWKEQRMNLGYRIPLNLTKSKYFTNLSFGSSLNLIKVKDYNQNVRSIDQVSNGTLSSLTHQLTYTRLLKRSARDINSTLGQAFVLNYQHTSGGDFKGKYLAMEGQLFFPGLAKHHSLNLKGGYQYRERNDATNNYVFPGSFYFPRGFSAFSFQNFYHLNVNYAFPIMYPDLAIGPLLNIQRLKGNLFYDHGLGETGGLSAAFNSMGIELSTDFNVMRYNLLLDVGVRVSYLPAANDVQFELMVLNLGF